MVYIGMDVHQKSTMFCILDASKEEGDGRYRTVKRETCREAFDEILGPWRGQCKVVFEIGTQAQWIAAIVRPLAAEVQVANPSRIPWLFRDGRKNDALDARKLATLLYLNQVPTVHLPTAGRVGLAGVDQPSTDAGQTIDDDQEPTSFDSAGLSLPLPAPQLRDTDRTGGPSL